MSEYSIYGPYLGEVIVGLRSRCIGTMIGVQNRYSIYTGLVCRVE